ncbi:MAG TPA: pilus assembly protein TadG-related protein [Bacillota bacterium]|nr:pilus assembly protein TadG-related protein [Bacillota bacterium]
MAKKFPNRLRVYSKEASSERGAIFVWMLFLLPLFLLLSGLVIDLATVYSLFNRVQTTMDAAGTSAVTFAMKEESLRESGDLVINEDIAREKFLWFISKNLNLSPELVPRRGSFLEGRITVSEIEISESPPSLRATLEVPFRTCIMQYLVDEVRIPIIGEYTLDKKIE